MDVIAGHNIVSLQAQQPDVAPRKSLEGEMGNIFHLIQESASSADSRMTDPS